MLFEHPGMVVLGIYHQGNLVAVDVSYRLGEVIFDDVFFSNTASQKLHVTNFVVHTLQEAASTTDAKWLCRGGITGKPSLDKSKQLRGAQLMAFPARHVSNPFRIDHTSFFFPDHSILH